MAESVDVVFTRPDGSQVLVTHWPAEDLWQLAERPRAQATWGPPLEVRIPSAPGVARWVRDVDELYGDVPGPDENLLAGQATAPGGREPATSSGSEAGVSQEPAGCILPGYGHLTETPASRHKDGGGTG